MNSIRMLINGIILLMMISVACSKDKDDKNVTEEGSFFFDAAKNTTPVIAPSTFKTADNWGPGNPLFLVFSILRDYDNDRDEGKVGLENIYKILYQTSSFFDGAQMQGISINEQVIESPFDFGNDDETYTTVLNDEVYMNGFAIKKTEEANYSLFGWYREDGDNTERGVLQGSFNKTSHDLTIDMVTYLEKESVGGMRVYISGNDTSHLFTIKFMCYTEGAYSVSVVGHGVSKGEGNYFLFRLCDWENGTPGIESKYYCFNAAATEDTLKGMDINGSDSVVPECDEYKNIVDDLDFFVMDDLPQSPADFNTGKESEGSIYLDYAE